MLCNVRIQLLMLASHGGLQSRRFPLRRMSVANSCSLLAAGKRTKYNISVTTFGARPSLWFGIYADHCTNDGNRHPNQVQTIASGIQSSEQLLI